MACYALGPISGSPHLQIGVPILQQLIAVVGDQHGEGVTNRLCAACVSLFGVDAAAIAVVFDGAHTATLGASGPTAQVLDDMQFTLGEGPGLDAVTRRTPVLVTDLADADSTTRWPTYRLAIQVHGIRCVYAIPIAIVGHYVGAPTLFRTHPGTITAQQLIGARVAAELAELAFLDLTNADLQAAVENPDNNSWAELTALTRAEVNRAIGMLVAQLNVGPDAALVRLCAHAYATDHAATDVARDIIARRVRLQAN